jgi:hypothetical protein
MQMACAAAIHPIELQGSMGNLIEYGAVRPVLKGNYRGGKKTNIMVRG